MPFGRLLGSYLAHCARVGGLARVSETKALRDSPFVLFFTTLNRALDDVAAGIAIPDLLWDDEALDGYCPDTRKERQPVVRRSDLGSEAQQHFYSSHQCFAPEDAEWTTDHMLADGACWEDEELELEQ